jgi:hypothetical protein
MSRPLTDKDKTDIVKQLTGGWSRIFTDAVDIFDRSNFVAGNESRSPLATAVRTITRFNCRRWARADKELFSTNVNQVNADICGQYLDGISENPDDGSISRAFIGGQCNDLYLVNWTRNFGGGITTATRLVRGPIGGTRAFIGGGSTRAQIFARNASTSDSTCGFLSDIGPAWYDLGSNSGSEIPGSTCVINSITPCPGNADNCGNITPDITQPNTPTGLPTLPPTITVNLPGLGPVDVGIDLNPDGTIEICIDQLDTCFTLDPISPDDGDAPDPGDVGEPDEEEDTDQDGEAEGCAPDGSVLGGLSIAIKGTPPNPNKYSDEVFRGVAFVYMGVEDNLALHPEASSMKNNQFFFPYKDNLTCWLVRANVGYSLGVTPYYKSGD